MIRPVAHQVRSIRDITPADLVTSPGRLELLSYRLKHFEAYDVLNPKRVVACAGVNERQAIDDAVLKLRVVSWRIRLRPALPVDALPSARRA